MSLKCPAYKVTYAGKNITGDVSKDLISISFADKVGGASDELTIVLDDPDGKWLGSWYPTKGDRIEGWLGDSEGTIAAGTYEIDQLDPAGPPDTLTIRALAVGPGKPQGPGGAGRSMRTNRTVAHEKKTLRQILTDYARRNGFTLFGTIADIRIDRATQDNESDLAFISRLAAEYGYIFNIKTDKLVFTDVYELENGRSILTLAKSSVSRWSASDRLLGVYAACEVSYHVPKTKKTERHTVKVSDGKLASGDTLKLNLRCENRQQAEAKAKAALHKANAKQKTVRIDMEGDRRIQAGVNITLGPDWKAIAGKFHVTTADHKVSRGDSYALSFEGKEV